MRMTHGDRTAWCVGAKVFCDLRDRGAEITGCEQVAFPCGPRVTELQDGRKDMLTILFLESYPAVRSNFKLGLHASYPTRHPAANEAEAAPSRSAHIMEEAGHRTT